jgi:hypothetical protein
LGRAIAKYSFDAGAAAIALAQRDAQRGVFGIAIVPRTLSVSVFVLTLTVLLATLVVFPVVIRALLIALVLLPGLALMLVLSRANRRPGRDNGGRNCPSPKLGMPDHLPVSFCLKLSSPSSRRRHAEPNDPNAETHPVARPASRAVVKCDE